MGPAYTAGQMDVVDTMPYDADAAVAAASGEVLGQGGGPVEIHDSQAAEDSKDMVPVSHDSMPATSAEPADTADFDVLDQKVWGC